MTREDVVAKVNRILEDEFELDPAHLNRDARFDELGLDSLDAVDLVVALEKAFECTIEEEEAREMQILGQVYDYICKAQGPPAS